MNSENSETSKPHVLMLKLTNKLDLRIGEKIIALSDLCIYYMWKNSGYDEIKVWFTDQNSQSLEIEDRINLTTVIKWKI